jgi:hypothetical protein
MRGLRQPSHRRSTRISEAEPLVQRLINLSIWYQNRMDFNLQLCFSSAYCFDAIIIYLSISIKSTRVRCLSCGAGAPDHGDSLENPIRGRSQSAGRICHAMESWWVPNILDIWELASESLIRAILPSSPWLRKGVTTLCDYLDIYFLTTAIISIEGFQATTPMKYGTSIESKIVEKW